MNHQTEEYAANGALLEEQEYDETAKMSVDDVSTASTGGGIKISEMINNEPVDDEEEEDEEVEAEEGEEMEEVSNTSPTQLAQPPSVTQSTSSLASTGTQGSNGSSTAPPQLNDAFAYLDKVRNEFADQPEIYNKFLQTMREFKANTIDANGVIMRVVQLFKGHRNLILGFNAFLPKTHHIDPNIQDFSRWAQTLPGNGGIDTTGTSVQAIQGSAQPMQYRAPLAPVSGPYLQPAPVHAAHHSSTSIGSASTSTSMSASTVPSIPAVGPSPALARGQQNVQFNRAVSFVEKIKNRFTAQPETYRAFLAILHSFHRDQRGIKEVYAQVQQLFRGEPDLLEEFTQFLPDTSSSSSSNGSSMIQPSSQPPQPGQKIHPGMLPPVGKFSSASSGAVIGSKRQATASASVQSSSSSASATFEKPKRSRPSDVPGTVPTSEETDFFDKVKRYLDNRQLYADFLKCLSLFSQDILKLPDLLAMVHSFIGGNAELFDWFKRYINYKDTDGPIWTSSAAGFNGNSFTSGKPSASSFAEAQVPELNLNALKRVGCYRIYPQGYRLCKASGRTLLCEEVLNDDMLSCPSFESEDSGFMASKKNQYEDALFKCEDERYEMDLLLEYNLATIAVLEPIARRLEQMQTQEERDAFRLDARLNGTSEIIYKKAIKRIYGDKGDDIYEYLQRSPAAAVPVVLKRLKAKDEEWRRVQRDWNRVWAEIHIKNYYKALDHQGIDFKTSDKKTLTLRSLVGEVINIKEERSKQPQRNSTSTGAHLSLPLGDTSVLKDLLHLIGVSIQSGPNFSGVDRKSLSRFFSTFIPEFLSGSNGGDSAVGSTSANGAAALSSVQSAQATSDEESGDGSGSGSESEESSIASTVPASTSTPNNTSNALLLYANDALFGVLRILSIAYERLERMKQAAEASQNRPFFKERVNVVAQFLDLQTRQASMSVDEELVGGRDFYGVLLYLTEQLILGELEPGLFEEKVRYMFGTGGFVMFTFDKVLLALLRQCLGVLNDGVCENLIRLYDSWRTRRGPRTSEYSARLAAENILSSSGSSETSSSTSNLFRIEFAPQRRLLGIHLVDKLAAGVGDSGAASSSIEDKWSLYVDNFVKLESNQAYLNPQSRVFLSRNHRLQVDRRDELLIAYNLECKICINTYKIFYVENTEDLLTKKCRRSSSSTDGKKVERPLPWN